MDLSTLYKKDRLVQVTEPLAKGEKSEVKKPLNFNGVAVLYEFQASTELPAEQEAFLNKIIEGGLKMIPTETVKANLCHADVTLQKLAEQIGAKKVVLFGTEWIEGLKNSHINKNEICLLYGMKVLVTDTLDVISSNDNAKKIFWGHLKKMF
ncbi:MAG: hypothetical protein JWO03_681 [Bacteroidetes bacterium]|nr:hypothetical protein [Bacteroidota bacterium]